MINRITRPGKSCSILLITWITLTFHFAGIFAVNIGEELRKCCQCFGWKLFPRAQREEARPSSGASMNGRTTLTLLGRSASSDSSDNRAGNNKRWLAKYSILKNSSRQMSKHRNSILCDVFSIEENGSETIPMTTLNKTDVRIESNSSSPVHRSQLNNHSKYNEV